MARPVRVYVVDDDPVIRMLVKAVLVGNGYTVTVAVDGDEALENVRSVKPDAIVLNVMMPGTDGFAVCRAIRDDATLSRQPYVMMLTAATSGTEAERAAEAGADEVMAKPFSPTELLNRLKAVLQ